MGFWSCSGVAMLGLVALLWFWWLPSDWFGIRGLRTILGMENCNKVTCEDSKYLYICIQGVKVIYYLF